MKTRKTRWAKGFTLLEMMLVVVIIGLLAAVAVYNIAGQGTKARAGRTKASLGIIKQALSSYFTEKGSYPPQIAIMVPEYLDSVPKDGWKRDFVYFAPSQEPGRPYTLMSLGEDSAVGTADDISIWTMDQ
jgi:general secretion pathway protein G